MSEHSPIADDMVNTTETKLEPKATEITSLKSVDAILLSVLETRSPDQLNIVTAFITGINNGRDLTQNPNYVVFTGFRDELMTKLVTSLKGTDFSRDQVFDYFAYLSESASLFKYKPLVDAGLMKIYFPTEHSAYKNQTDLVPSDM